VSALPVIGGLAVAYLDRIASGDTTRAAIVMTELVSVWPDFRADFAREIAEANAAAGGRPLSVTYPSTLSPTWGGATQIIIATSVHIAASPSSALGVASDALYDANAANLRESALAVMNVLPASAPLRRYVRAASGSISSIPGALDTAITATVAYGSVGPAQDPPPAPPAPPAPPRSSTPFVAADTRIVGSTGSPTSSNWAWWALGGAAAVGLLIFAGVRLSNATAEA